MRKSKKNSPGPPLVGDELFKSIEEACEGLIYISETDAPVKPFILTSVSATDGITSENLGGNAGQSVEERSPEEFFEKLTVKREWYGRPQIELAGKFARLQNVLEKNLSDLKVVRTGNVKITIMVAGRDGEGRLMGVRTQAVET